MLSPNLAFILFSKYSLSVYGQVFNPNSVQSADLSALINAIIMKFNVLFTSP